MKTPFEHHKDRLLLVAVFTLLVVGILMVYSASAFWSAEKNQEDYTHVLRAHLLRVAIGLLVLVVFSRIDYHRFRRWTPHMLTAMVFLLAAVLVTPPFRGSHRAFPLPVGRFQPAEYMKLVLVLYLASVLAKGFDWKTVGTGKLRFHYVFLVVITALVLFEPDLGTAMVIFCTGFLLFAIAGTPGGRLVKMVTALIPLIALGLVANTYQRQRIVDFVDSKVNGTPPPYQVQQSQIALASGGLAGSGYGEGNAKKLFLPEPFSDFILSTLGEEFGFLGISFLFLVLVFVLWRGTRIAIRAPDRYGFLVASGITSLFMINALINAGVVTYLLPTTGLPFPFISFGGSSLFVYMAGMGILLNISGKTVASYHQFTNERGRVRWPQVR